MCVCVIRMSNCKDTRQCTRQQELQSYSPVTLLNNDKKIRGSYRLMSLRKVAYKTNGRDFGAKVFSRSGKGQKRASEFTATQDN